MGVNTGLNVMKDGVETHNSWNIGLNTKFDLLDNLSLIMGAELADSTAYEEPTFGFTTSFSYSIF